MRRWGKSRTEGYRDWEVGNVELGLVVVRWGGVEGGIGNAASGLSEL
jgi:hypothetical protein